MPFLPRCSMLTELLERIFSRHKKENSRASAKRRLQIVLAHDRTDLSPAVVDKMRQEILEVVSRYVEIDPEESEFSLESDQRTTALIANLPIRKVKDSKSEEANNAGTTNAAAPLNAASEEVLELSMDSTELPVSTELSAEELSVATVLPDPPQTLKPIDRTSDENSTTTPKTPQPSSHENLPPNPPQTP